MSGLVRIGDPSPNKLTVDLVSDHGALDEASAIALVNDLRKERTPFKFQCQGDEFCSASIPSR